ncbi:hypothetical protein Ga0080574_TMP1071 [Salipiger abyssi]|uniref:Uncharacterized protein n=1 Tax=Salipiger abyssi TaxID=1250539 RepID=A0A1P8UPU2_9RHOB|nr:hypothetical protein Ga0080574_TMP1071 [Salipiger abyssi]
MPTIARHCRSPFADRRVVKKSPDNRKRVQKTPLARTLC